MGLRQDDVCIEYFIRDKKTRESEKIICKLSELEDDKSSFHKLKKDFEIISRRLIIFMD